MYSPRIAAHTSLADRPSYTGDTLQGDATLPVHSFAEAQPEARRMLSTGSAVNPREDHRLATARSPPSSRAAAIRRLGYRSRDLKRFDFSPTSPLFCKYFGHLKRWNVLITQLEFRFV